MTGASKENREIACCEYFLDWYNKQHKRDYIYKKTEANFAELKGKLCWDFMVYERDSPQGWIGIEVKELQFLRETSIRFTFWECLCSELTKHLPGKGIQGEFEISFPPVLGLPQNERQRLLDAFSQVLIDKQSGWEVRESKDIGPDIANKFPNWPKEKSEPFDEYDKWGTYRPCKLEIKKISDPGCEVISPISPIVVRDGAELHKKTFNEADIEHANEQLKLAKEKGARKTILLFAGYPFIEESLIKDQVQNLDPRLISGIDSIYLVDMDNEDSVVKMYPS